MADMLFTTVPRILKDLIAEIESGKLALPELQRGYVWKATKVRDLLDSMMKGYPIGYLMIWDPAFTADGKDKYKPIGLDNKSFSSPKSLMIDGQQRMTSLYSVMGHKEVIDHKFNPKYIIISFNPLTREIEVGDNAKKRAAEWIYDIGDVFLNYTKSFAYINNVVKTIAEGREKSGLLLSDEETEAIQQNITDLLSLLNYSIPTLQINGNADEESVADIFVRVNSGGQSLKEDDFILTLISVYWQDGRQYIEDFCKGAKEPKTGTAYNFVWEPTPTNIVRVAMSFGFKRARLRYAYKLLRGRDFESEVYSDALREERFKTLQQVINQVLNVEVWHEFIKCVESAGFISKSIISSQNALVYTYAMFLIGKFDYGIKSYDLRKLISRWFFVTFISGYYTGSVETRVERDLADIRNVKNGEEFVSILDSKINDIFTDDYFINTLPNALATSSARNPAWYGYCASLNILDAKVLFSQLHTRELFSPASSGTKSALERHHLFPKAYLARKGITEDRERNQNANFAFIEWQTNIEILDTSPTEYMQDQLDRIPNDEKDTVYKLHALPENWENMDYFDFLVERRILMAQVIRQAFDKITGNQPNSGKTTEMITEVPAQYPRKY
jgi:hypothetical protein